MYESLQKAQKKMPNIKCALLAAVLPSNCLCREAAPGKGEGNPCKGNFWEM